MSAQAEVIIHKELTHKQAKEVILQAMQNKGTFLKAESGMYDYVKYRIVIGETTYEVQHATNDSVFVYTLESHGAEEELENVYCALLSSVLGKDENPDKNIYFAQ